MHFTPHYSRSNELHLCQTSRDAMTFTHTHTHALQRQKIKSQRRANLNSTLLLTGSLPLTIHCRYCETNPPSEKHPMRRFLCAMATNVRRSLTEREQNPLRKPKFKPRISQIVSSGNVLCPSISQLIHSAQQFDVAKPRRRNASPSLQHFPTHSFTSPTLHSAIKRRPRWIYITTHVNNP